MRLTLGSETGLQPGTGLTPPTNLGPPRRYMTIALTVAALLGLGWLATAHGNPTPPPLTVLGDGQLTGVRGPTCLRLVVGVDDSGSMTNFGAARDRALSSFLAWTPGNLRPDDTVTVIDFSADAVARTIPTQATTPNEGQTTLLEPVLRQIDKLPASVCDTALVLLSDAQLADLPGSEANGRALLREHHIHDVRLLVPGDTIQVPPEWSVVFPTAAEERFDGNNSDQTALAFGRTVASLTGQSLSRTP